MRSHEMTAHSDLLDRYKRIREVRFRLNNLLVGTIPKKTLEDCGRKLGLFRKGTQVFGSEDEMSQSHRRRSLRHRPASGICVGLPLLHGHVLVSGFRVGSDPRHSGVPAPGPENNPGGPNAAGRIGWLQGVCTASPIPLAAGRVVKHGSTGQMTRWLPAFSHATIVSGNPSRFP